MYVCMFTHMVFDRVNLVNNISDVIACCSSLASHIKL